MLAAVWHQRRNQGSLWMLGLIAALAVVPPLGVLALAVAHGSVAPEVSLGLRAVLGAIFQLVGLGLWAAIVANLLQQNHPTAARLVPGHVRRLRRMLLATWAVMVVALGLLPGLLWTEPLAATTGAALTLAGVALIVRWPVAGVCWFMLLLMLPQLIWRIQPLWFDHAVALTLGVTAACAVLVPRLARDGGTRHARAYARRLDRDRRSRAAREGASAANLSARGLGGAVATRPYFWCLRRQLARTDSPVSARLLLGLGPSLHWTSAANTLALSAAGFATGCGLAACLDLDLGQGLLGVASVGVLFTVGVPLLQTRPRLWQVRGEQALLMLLPGVPRGGALNRWLGLRLSAQFALGLGGAIGLSAGMQALASAVADGHPVPDLAGFAHVIEAVLLPLAPLVWRRWHRLHAPAGAAGLTPALAAVALATAYEMLNWLPDVGIGDHLDTLAGACFAASVAWCVLRWQRAGHEPAHLPVGRAAR